jgi:hypothetical protein
MTAVLIFGAAPGIGLGLARFKIFALLPAILIVAAGTLGSDLAAGLDFRFIGLAVLVAVISLQIAYLLSFLTAAFVVAKYLRARAMSNVPVFLHAMRTEPLSSRRSGGRIGHCQKQGRRGSGWAAACLIRCFNLGPLFRRARDCSSETFLFPKADRDA